MIICKLYLILILQNNYICKLKSKCHEKDYYNIIKLPVFHVF